MSASWLFQIGGFAARGARTAKLRKLRALVAGLSVIILAGLLPLPAQAQAQPRRDSYQPVGYPNQFSISPVGGPGWALYDGFSIGGELGALNGNSDFTNQQQLTGCPPFCLPDFTPNPTATLNSSGFHGGPSVGYNKVLPNVVFQNPLIVGFQAFYSFGSSTNTIPGIPGTFGPGGIATVASAANDSTSVRFGNNAGILGKVGTAIYVAGMPVMIAFDGGVTFQRVDLTLNCTTLGACGANGIPAQSLTDSQTRTGSLIGGEINVPLPLELFLSRSWSPIVGVQILHGDLGNVSTTLGDPRQIQIFAKQHLTTDSVMGTLTFSYLSDMRLKRDIVALGRLDNGLTLYRYRYLWNDQVYVGVMAQEVASVTPDAVVLGPDGYLRVNYQRLGLRMQTWEEWTASH